MTTRLTLTCAIAIMAMPCHGQAVAEAAPALSDPAAIAAPAAPPGPHWTLHAPKTSRVPFQGAVSFDEAGEGQGNMVYPAIGGLVGFAAAIVTHGLIVQGQKSAEKTRLQVQADKVLTPFGDVLQNFQLAELMRKGLEKTTVVGQKKLAEELASDEPGWIIDSLPVFSMTQDRGAIILDNVLMVRKPGSTAETAYKNTVRVVSDAQKSEDLQTHWHADGGARLKDESIRLFAHSLDLVLAEAQREGASTDQPVRKTVRYMEGTKEKMERGEVMAERCGRVVIKTLRGWVMSVPAKAGVATGECG